MNKFYITTAIDYVDATIHIGHAFQKVVADVLARYYRIKIGKENIFFLTGTDEYGQKVEKAAKKAEIKTKEFVNQISASDKEQQDSLNISYDRFLKTTDPDHAQVAQEIWRRVEKNGDIYLGEYQGIYCEGCEAFYTEKDLADDKCPFHLNLEIKQVSEENYFFKWAKYKDFLKELLKNNPDFVIPESRRKEMVVFVDDIRDIPISRTNFSWGIPVPDHPGHVMYVWFDALTNYLTGVGFLENPKLFEKFWPADVHILGKDNVRWHALLWPAMLKSAGIELPKTVLVNGFLSLNGQKISKSLGNIIRPKDWTDKYGVDSVRYYLLRYTTLTEDSDVSEEKLKTVYNADLANGLGNLVARVARIAQNYNLEFDKELRKTSLSNDIETQIERFNLSGALELIWQTISGIDRYIDRERPWESKEKATRVLWEIVVKGEAVNTIREIASVLEPFLPETSAKIKEQFSGPKIKSNPPLFPRLT